MINYRDEKITLQQEKNSQSQVVSWSNLGILDFCKPIARRQPDVIIIHVGTKDLRIKDEKEIAKNIATIKNTIT